MERVDVAEISVDLRFISQLRPVEVGARMAAMEQITVDAVGNMTAMVARARIALAEPDSEGLNLSRQVAKLVRISRKARKLFNRNRPDYEKILGLYEHAFLPAANRFGCDLWPWVYGEADRQSRIVRGGGEI